MNDNACSYFNQMDTPYESKSNEKLNKQVPLARISLNKQSLLREVVRNADQISDRFIPYRMKENLQAKFEAASQN